MNTIHPIVFLFDVDNTLLDNDRFQDELSHHLSTNLDDDVRKRYWDIVHELSDQLGYVDYLGALERYRLEALHRPEILRLSSWILDYPFKERLFPNALDAIRHVQQWGSAVILSDGDAVFQPHKIERSGLWEAVEGKVLIYIHKERELQYVERLYPADHYVLIDDKLRILDAVKSAWGEKVTTVFPKQGHYALDPAATSQYRPADIELDRIAELIAVPKEALLNQRRKLNA
jgi:FMN phosphatase YigB (HAD superfamily)